MSGKSAVEAGHLAAISPLARNLARMDHVLWAEAIAERSCSQRLPSTPHFLPDQLAAAMRQLPEV